MPVTPSGPPPESPVAVESLEDPDVEEVPVTEETTPGSARRSKRKHAATLIPAGPEIRKKSPIRSSKKQKPEMHRSPVKNTATARDSTHNQDPTVDPSTIPLGTAPPAPDWTDVMWAMLGGMEGRMNA